MDTPISRDERESIRAGLQTFSAEYGTADGKPMSNTAISKMVSERTGYRISPTLIKGFLAGTRTNDTSVRAIAKFLTIVYPEIPRQRPSNSKKEAARRTEGKIKALSTPNDIGNNKPSALDRLIQFRREAGSGELGLSVDQYAEALATLLRSAEGEFCFAVFGRWGIGKTTLVRHMEPILKYASTPGQRLSDYRPNGKYYDVIWHSAWKYKRAPEAWVYIYKSLVQAAKSQSNSIERFFITIRAGTTIHGYWPLALALLMMALTALPLSVKWQYGVWIVTLLGVSSTIYAFSIFYGLTSKIKQLFLRHVRLANHDEKLGLLTLIGDDTIALLKAWIPNRSKKPRKFGRIFSVAHSIKELFGSKLSTRKFFASEVRASMPRVNFILPKAEYALPFTSLVAVGIIWGIAVLGDGDSTWHLLDWGASILHDISRELKLCDWNILSNESIICTGPYVPGLPQQIAVADQGFTLKKLTFLAWTSFVIGVFILPSVLTIGAPDRLLLVVDDLDRCGPEEMLEIVETLKLLLEEPPIRSRLQILMLVDEDILSAAIARKYSHVYNTGATLPPAGNEIDRDSSNTRREVVAEHIEKIFACYLRLPPLGPAEITEAVELMAGNVSDEAATGDSFPPEVLETSNPAVKSEPIEDRDNKFEKQVVFSLEEVEELKGCVPAFFNTVERHPNPRAIRALLFKIQLCRLLIRLHQGEAVSVASIAGAIATATGHQQSVTNRISMEAIASQVA